MQRCGFGGFPDEGSFFLGVRAMERLYANRHSPAGFDPPDQPDAPFWRSEWIPFLSDQDGWTGRFVDARDGRGRRRWKVWPCACGPVGRRQRRGH
ncbi:hypothetical protein GCM10010287_03000 [Streptomyces variabilis]|uniref:Uncharacterized protein n=1 Tax=Streptomyces variabilis TaxID=67372 RepID=A0ABQ2TSJ3_9ACTN|nr:hypothetical protein GCM10010265_38580 [Streptomyces griseoincarnatus]GGT33986.1 hypothetical protein GCM10010287_03000 [Streptomyces variabilis]